MGWDELVGGFLESVSLPRPHKHLVAIIAVDEASKHQHMWSVDEARDGESVGVGFFVRKGDTKSVAAISTGICSICGDEALLIEPHELGQRLPEWRIGTSHP